MTYGTSSDSEPDLANDNFIQTRLSCLLEGRSPAERDQDRAQILANLHLLASNTIPVFDEATQTVARQLAMPICILSVIDADLQQFKSVVGLSSLGLMNPLAAARSIPRTESFCTHVIDSGKPFALADATAHPAFSRSLLVQHYGIQSYLGVPLITHEGCCIGTLAVMNLLPREFTQQEVAFLEISARWCISEFEKQHILTALKSRDHALQSAAVSSLHSNSSTQAHTPSTNSSISPSSLSRSSTTVSSLLSKINQVRFDLIVQLTQDLRNPLTSITGMANMLSREIYGPLSEKQQEYAKIVLSSSQQLLAMVDEIVEVGDLEEGSYQLALATVDIEMVGQQALAALSSLAKQQDLQLKLTVEPGSRLWNLDKRVVKQLIYHLAFSIIKMSPAGSTVRLHISRREEGISIALWVSNPWLGEDLPQAVIAWEKSGFSLALMNQLENDSAATRAVITEAAVAAGTETITRSSKDVFQALATAQKVDISRQTLGLLLSRHLTEIHGGTAFVQGSAATGYRYIITLPSLQLSV